MFYYHLSSDKDLHSILPSKSERLPGICLPRIPESCADEDQKTLRVCIAPAVWLCLLSGPRKGPLYIYAVDPPAISDPNLSPIGNSSDFPNTGEKWITDNDIVRSGGKIGMSYKGFTIHTFDVECAIRAFIGLDRPITPSAASDTELWDIRGAQWFLRD